MKKVMIVDDDKEFLDEMAEILSLSGYSILKVNDEQAVFSSVSKDKPDIILLDLKLGKQSGFNIARELKRNVETRHVPIIGVTGYYTEEEYSELMRVCGIRRHLIKPVSPQEIVNAVEEEIGS